MTADTCDYEELNNGLPRKEKVLLERSIEWMVKLWNSTRRTIIWFNYVLCWFFSLMQQHNQRRALNRPKKSVFSLIPIIGTLIAIDVMRDYEINEDRAAEIRAQLQQRKGEI